MTEYISLCEYLNICDKGVPIDVENGALDDYTDENEGLRLQ